MDVVQVNIHEAKTHFSRLVGRAEAGEEVVVARAGKPVAKLVGYEPARRPRTLGLLEGEIEIHDDFDDPLPEFQPYMHPEGSPPHQTQG
jgi:prevent-host-death family protein